jgi:hypothetical protein
MQKYSVNQYLIENILSWANSGEIAIPEIQRPFVWDSTKVRNLMDSLYRGYPVGYLIAWRNPKIRLKDGTSSDGKKILIDGQQRVTAMIAAILGKKIIDKDYKKKKITISFHPIEERFEVYNPAIEKDVSWIPDISVVLLGEVSMMSLIRDYCAKNPNVTEDQMEKSIVRLQSLIKRQLGLIELSGDLDIETVTDIFVRINSQGVVLSQADFAMSKIASNEKFGGQQLRKFIDYFCHLSKAPDFFDHISEIDQEFANSEYINQIEWLKNENEDLYDPEYKDVLHVSFTSEFDRGRLSDLVGLLSGRNFETRTYEELIEEDTYKRLGTSISKFVNETDFKRFLMIIKSAGFIDKSLIRSKSPLNFAYIVYLKLRKLNYPSEKIERLVRKWFVMSVFTARYSSSPESAIDYDIRKIVERGFENYLSDIEKADLSDAFWEASLTQSLDTAVASSPYFHIFLASQVANRDKGFLSREITVADLINLRGDIHHLFPKEFLKQNGLSQWQYNQIANYVYMQSEVNIKIGKKSPREYFSSILKQVENGEMNYGAITSKEMLFQNFKENCIPEFILEAEFIDYEKFLVERRKLMAKKMRLYYEGL